MFSEAFNSTKETLSQEYAPYEDVSGFFVVIDTTTGLPAGALRYVDGGIDLNPTLRDLDEIGTLPEVAAEMRELLEYHPDAWDIDSYEVHEAYRGHHGGYRTTGLLGRLLVVCAREREVPGLSLVASEHAHQTQQVIGFPERLLSDEPLVYPDGVSMLVAWVDIAKAESSMLDHLAGLRARADEPTVARELPILEPFILGVATGEGCDEFIDTTPR